MNKNYFSLLLLCFGFGLNAQVINFPDVNLKARLLQSDLTNDIAGYVKIDANGDGEIEVSEIQNVMFLNISNASISDLTGLNYFNLSGLNCSFNEITNLNGLSQPNLEALNCGHNSLTGFSATNLPFLVDLNCAYNFIESVDLSSLGFTDSVDISNNNISSFFPPQYIVSLDIRKNNFNGFAVPDFAMEAILLFGGNPSDQLIYSDTWRNPKELILFDENVESIDLSNVPMSEYETDYLQPRFHFSDCYALESIKINNGLISSQYSGDLYIVDCPNLSSICADTDEVVFFNQRLAEMNLSNQIQVLTECNLAISDLAQNTIVLHPNPVNNILNIEVGNLEITSIEIYNVLGQSILFVSDKTSLIDVSALTAGTYFIKLISDKGILTSKFIKQ